MLTPVMSAGRQFTAPQPLDSQLSRSRQDSVIMASDQKRSMESAKETTQSFDRAKQEPLSASKTTESKPGITFAAQDSLPKLPIPDLESTAKKYLQALDPLQTAREHADTEHAVTEFLRTDGPALQEKLKSYAQGKSSYIEQFCTYLMTRCQYTRTDCIKGTTPTSISTTLSSSTSTRSSFSKTTPRQPATTKSPVLPHWRYPHFPSQELSGRRNSPRTPYVGNRSACTNTRAFSVLLAFPQTMGARSARILTANTSSFYARANSTGSMCWTTMTT